MSVHMRGLSTKSLIAGALIAMGMVAVGCNTPPQVNPWVDDTIPQSEWSTPSRDGVLAANHAKVMHTRPGASVKQGPYVSGDVPHYPLYWEDPFTDKGDGDRYFAWTYADYIAMPYVFGRYIVNTIGSPISMVVHPPGTSMVSDGVVGKDHDTQVGKSPNPTAGPSDFGFESDPDTTPDGAAEGDSTSETSETSTSS